MFRVALAPSTPMYEETLSTAGSASTLSASACWRCDMAAKEIDCAASVVAWMAPVSCTGKKPLGTTKYSPTVSARVAANTSMVSRPWSITLSSMRP